MSTRKTVRALVEIGFVAASLLLAVSVFGGTGLLGRLGLGLLGRWGAWILWLGFLLLRSLKDRSLLSRFPRFRSEWILVVVLVLSLFLRWPMASLDLEHYVGPDEGELVESTLEMMKTGDLHPRHPGYPGLFFYLQMGPATAYLLCAAAKGEGSSIRDLPREDFYRVARQTSLFMGWVAALVVYFVGRSWTGRPAAVLAGALVALSPLAFRESKVVNPDLMLMLFVTCGLGLSLQAMRRPGRWHFAWAGVGIGLATAVKYTGALLVAPYIIAWLLCGEPRRRLASAGLGLGLANIAFIVASPYTLLDLPSFLHGMTRHFGYYSAAQMNVPGELSRILATTGLGIPAAVAAFAGSVWILSRLDKSGLLILSYPAAYFLLFSFLHRAYPRHALVLLPSFAILAAGAAKRCYELYATRKGAEVPPKGRLVWLASVGFILLLALPLVDTVLLGVAIRRPTPAQRAAEWVEANIPPGSRILEDQLTPRLDLNRYRIHRLRVGENVFAGNFDWVLHSGYPPGLVLNGLRSVARFYAGSGAGTAITLYQVPEREALMGVTLDGERREVTIRAGELPYFGDGWMAPSPSAHGTTRLSEGLHSEIYFVLARSNDEALPTLDAEIVMSQVPSLSSELAVGLELNDEALSTFSLPGAEPEEHHLVLPSSSLRRGLNRVILRYGDIVRLNRRHREAAVRFFRMRLWEN